MKVEKFDLMDGDLHLFKRPDSQYWQCATFLEGYNYRQSTGEVNPILAKEFAKYWYMELHINARRKRLANQFLPYLDIKPELLYQQQQNAPVQQAKKAGRTFEDAAERFLAEYQVINEGQRNERYAKSHERRLRVHLLPFFGDKFLSEINGGIVQDYRIMRRQSLKHGKPPARNTVRSEEVTLRMVLKTAQRCQWIEHVPDTAPAFKPPSKISHRGWFSPEEYKALYTLTRQRTKDPKRLGWRDKDEKLHDFVLFMANTGLRPDEAFNLQYRDVQIVDDESTNERILEIEVRGKRGIGFCKSMRGAVRPYERMKERNNPQPTDLIFGRLRSDMFNKILIKLNLKFDRDGNMRSAYSLRHTYICLRLMEGADIYQIAKNCRTSVKMIQNHYAVHLKNTLDASAINVRKDRSKSKIINDRKSLLDEDSE